MDRLIVCQGTAQLVTAVAALHRHQATLGPDGGRGRPRDHLLICGLAVAESQTQAFTRVIEQMAALLHPFSTISRLDDSDLAHVLRKARRASSSAEIAALLRQATGIGNVDEVFAVRDWQACNILAFNAFPEAIHICYGDSVGVYLPRGFMAGRPAVRSRITGVLRRFLSSRSALFLTPRVDTSYLLLPGAFGMPPGGQVIRTEAAPLRDLFTHLGPLLDGVALDHLRARSMGRPVWVLMGSNFSEQGMMTPQAELAAYRDWIAALDPDPGAVLLIKSHPRDRTGKREHLEEQMRGLFSEILSADSVGSAYLPVEALLINLMPIAADLRTLTVSTACLATTFVVGSRTEIGFGDQLVAKYVVANRRRERCQHESDLRRLCAA
ncbi:MAG TPA: polysialyltransferase family glycosyltransferase [Steroidobacteraceae bacterium]|jgi:hypothetical protein|nr:polysialyltransferase family glycosyltransferase [Steroidobacteraceae bacterium]